MSALDSARLGALFKERARISDEWHRAEQAAQRLTLDHNEFVWAAGHAATTGGRQRAQGRAGRKGEEAEHARAHSDELRRKLDEKETEIAELITALWAASQPLLSNDTVRQLNDNLEAIRRHLQSIDSQAAPVIPALRALQAVIQDQSVLIKSVSTPQSGPRSSGKPEGDTDRPALRHNGGQAPIVQMGWKKGIPPVAEPRSPQLSDEAVAALPEQVTVVLFASEPRDRPRPDLDKEIREILAMIDQATFGDRITMRPWPAAQPFDLIPGFNRHKPHMVQFSGHGTADGVLMMGPHDRSEPVTADRLIQMFRWTGENLRMVFFNICDSEQHARAAAQFVDAAIGMRGTMHDAPARAFAAHLYSGLAFGNSLKRAFHQACTAIGDEPDSLVPQLFFRHGVDPHKVVLVRPEDGDTP